MTSFQKTKKLIAALLMNVMLTTHVLWAENIIIDAKNKETFTDETYNGVPVVNIAKPTGAGISSNAFKDYNVGEEGVIVNNGLGDSETLLGGTLYGNPNFGSQTAELIIFDVRGTNRSQLKGFTEIAGDEAGFVLANPNGIYVNGAGFINTNRVTLTTGQPSISGSSVSYGVSDGTITVDTGGLWTLNTPYVDLLAKTVQVNGYVVGTQNSALTVIAGSNRISHGGLETVSDSVVRTGTAIDTAALGGMYHGKIKLISTDAGAGAHAAGDIVTYAGDLELGSNGDLSYGTAYAAKDLKLKSSGVLTQTKQGIALGALSAESKGSMRFKGEGLYAGGRASFITSANLEMDGSEVKSAAFLQAGDLSLKAGQAVSINQAIIVGNGLNIEAKDGVLNNVAVLGNGAAVVHVNDLKQGRTQWINFKSLKLQADGRLVQEGIGVSVNSMSIQAPQVVSYQDSIQTNAFMLDAQNATVNASFVLAKSSAGITTNRLSNTGSQVISLGDMGINTGTFINTNGAITYAQNTLRLGSDQLENTKDSMVMSGKSGVWQINHLRNADSTLGVQTGDLTLAGITAQNTNGTIQAENRLSMVVGDSLVNGSLGTITAKDTQIQVPFIQNQGEYRLMQRNTAGAKIVLYMPKI